MTTHDDGGPAFPQAGLATINGSVADFRSLSPGLSLRDWFAGQALAGLIASDRSYDVPSDEFASDAYTQAESMLAEKRRYTAKQESATTQTSGVSIRDAGFSSRARNALERRAKARTLEDVCKLTPGEVLHLRCIGKQTLYEIERVLASFGLELRREGGGA